MNLQLRKLSIVFRQNKRWKTSVGKTTARDNVSGHPHAPGRRNHGSMVSPSSTSQHLCASDRDACKRAGPRPYWTESATIDLLSAREMVIWSVPSPPTPLSKISTLSSAALVDLHQAQLRPRRLHVCVATRRRPAVWTRGAVSTAS